MISIPRSIEAFNSNTRVFINSTLRAARRPAVRTHSSGLHTARGSERRTTDDGQFHTHKDHARRPVQWMFCPYPADRKTTIAVTNNPTRSSAADGAVAAANSV